MKLNSLPLHKLSDTENTKKLDPLFLNAVRFKVITLLRRAVTWRKTQVQFIETLAHAIKLGNLNRRKEGVVNLEIRCFGKCFSFEE